jgi:hypothetical protein
MSRAQRRAAWLGRHRTAAGPAAPAPTVRSRPAVRLHIGELALHGLPPLSRHDVAEAVRAELTGLIAAEGLPAQLLAAGRTERLRGTPITLPRDGQAGAAGSRIARSVFGGSGR